jgi:hypothetical protein
MNNFFTIAAIISLVWTTFAAGYTMLWVVRQVSIETDAVHVVPDKESTFYLFNWQTWTPSELYRYITRKFWPYFLPTAGSFLVTIVLILMAV